MPAMTLEQAQSLLDDIDQGGRGLTDWEVDFIDDLLRQTDAGKPPTERQAHHIRVIHHRRYIRGDE